MQTIYERFCAKFIKSENGCWEWIAYINKDGYGRFAPSSGKPERAHRVAYQLFVGPIPKGLCICHRCDNRHCVNPSHLFLGTNNDNVRDKMSKGRFKPNYGSHNGMSKLTQQDVSNIRNSYSAGETMGQLSKQHNVTKQTIFSVIHYKTWR